MALQMNKEQDPLMRRPLAHKLKRDAPHKLQLYAEDMPRQNFEIRDEEFGLLLVNRSRVVPLDRAAKPLLDMLDGTHSLRTIEQQFGQKDLDLIGQLYQAGLVRLEETTRSV